MKLYSVAVMLLAPLVGVSAGHAVYAQDVPPTRSITSDDFSKRPKEAAGRPGRPQAAGASATRKRPVAYKFVRRDKSAVRWTAGNPKARPNAAPVKASTVTTDIGVTIWKLRPARAGDSGVKLPVLLTDVGRTEMWTPERVAADAAFRQGDKIRMAVESPTKGFLYIINSEMKAGGSLGPPLLIFPNPMGQDNGVGPGMLVDVPDQKDDWPYFSMRSTSSEYGGELVAIVVSPKPIAFRLDTKQYILNLNDVLDLGTDLDFEVFGRTDTDDSIFSQAEAAAACGSRSRELVREKAPTKPCGTASRQLTRDEPQPQSVYRVKTYAGRPAVAIIRLAAGT